MPVIGQTRNIHESLASAVQEIERLEAELKQRRARDAKVQELVQSLGIALGAMLVVAEYGECEAMHPDLAEEMARAALKDLASYCASIVAMQEPL